jgi:hypothetical protein
MVGACDHRIFFHLATLARLTIEDGLVMGEISTIGDLVSLQEDAEKLGEAAHGISVAVTFVQALQEGTFTKKNARYVYEPNFITFSFHTSRKSHVTITLRGEVGEFEPYTHLPLRAARGSSYSACNYSNILQLDALLTYIKRAHGLFTEGPKRTRFHRDIKATPRSVRLL